MYPVEKKLRILPTYDYFLWVLIDQDPHCNIGKLKNKDSLNGKWIEVKWTYIQYKIYTNMT